MKSILTKLNYVDSVKNLHTSLTSILTVKIRSVINILSLSDDFILGAVGTCPYTQVVVI